MGTNFFYVFIFLLAIQRLFELRLSNKNEAKLLQMGGKEIGESHYVWMKALHTLWFVAMLCEVILLNRTQSLPWALAALCISLIGQIFRYMAISKLGVRWTTKIIILPNKPAICGGIFKFIRHPNYVGVMLEIAFVPLIQNAYLTALSFSILNCWLLNIRIKEEENGLKSANKYSETFAHTPRFFPNSLLK